MGHEARLAELCFYYSLATTTYIPWISSLAELNFRVSQSDQPGVLLPCTDVINSIDPWCARKCKHYALFMYIKIIDYSMDMLRYTCLHFQFVCLPSLTMPSKCQRADTFKLRQSGTQLTSGYSDSLSLEETGGRIPVPLLRRLGTDTWILMSMVFSTGIVFATAVYHRRAQRKHTQTVAVSTHEQMCPSDVESVFLQRRWKPLFPPCVT